MSDTAKPSSDAPEKKSGESRFDSEALPDKIGTSLRSLYDEVLNEDVPDDFLNLLKKADDAAKSGTSKGGAK
jgi:hypothetical protein